MESFYWTLKDEKTLKEIAEKYPDALNILEKEGLFAKKLAEDPELWKLDPGSRLAYVKREAKKLVNGKSRPPDFHGTSAILQTVYDVDMNMNPINANVLILSNYLLKMSEEIGAIKIEGETFTVTAQPVPEEEMKKYFSPEQIKKMNETAEMSEEEMDEHFESISFLPSGVHFDVHPKAEEFIEPPTRIFREAFLKRFGNATIPIVKLNPYPFAREIVESSVKFELGVPSIPQHEIKISDSTSPHTEGNVIAIPRHSLSSEHEFLIGYSIELPHVVLDHKPVNVKPENRNDRINYFKHGCWQEGTASRVTERSITEYLFSKAVPEYASQKIAMETVEYISENPVNEGFLEQRPDIVIHDEVSHPFGWWFVRKIPRPTFQKMLENENSYLSNVFPWNSGKIDKVDYETIRRMYSTLKERSMHRYEGTELYGTLLKSLKSFEEDFKIMSGTPLT